MLPAGTSSCPPWVQSSPKLYVIWYLLLANHELNPSVIKSTSNDTLDDNLCPNAGGSGHEQDDWFGSGFTPLVNRLNTAAPGANLTGEDVDNIMALCPFDSLVYGRLSPFCQMFDDGEFELFQYADDIDKYYGTG